MSHDEIFKKVQGVLVDALGVDDDEVTPTARLTTDLHAESIDFLDIVFRIEKAFGFKIGQGELFPDNINDPNWQELTTSQVKSEPITVELDKQDQMATSLLTASPQE